MPKIPTLQENQRLRAGNPTGFQSSSAARIRGESLQQFGRGVASLGAAVDAGDKRRAAASQRLAEADFKSTMVRAQQDVNERIAQRPASKADTDKEEYDLMMAEAKHNVLNGFSEKYEGKYTDSFNNIANGVDVAGRGSVITNGLKKQKQAMQEGIIDLTKNLNSNVYSNPETLRDSLIDYSVSVSGTMADLGANEDQVVAANNEGHKALADTAIDGFIDQGKYNEAREVVLGETSHLYDSKEQKESLKLIRDRRLQDISIKQRQDDRLESDKEKQAKKQRESIAVLGLGLINNAETPSELAKAESFINNHARQGNLAYSQFGGLLNEADSQFKEFDAGGSFRLAKQVYNAVSEGDYDKVQSQLLNLVETKNISAKTGEKWERIIRNMKKSRTKDPKLAAEIDAYKGRLLGHTKPMDLLTKMGVGPRRELHIKRKYEAEFMYDVLTGVEGVEPNFAYAVVVNRFFKNIEGLTPFPGYNKIPKNLDDLGNLAAWGRGTLTNPDEIASFKSYMQEAKAAIESKDLSEEAVKTYKELQTDKRQAHRIDQAFMRSQELTKELFNFEELTMPRGKQQPLIFRRD